MHPYAARQLVARLDGVSLDQLHAATEAIADLEVWCRGGADYGEELAFDPGAAAGGRRGSPSRDFRRRAGGPRLLASAVSGVQGARWTALSIRETRERCSLLDRGGVALSGRLLETAKVRLHGARQAPVLGVLASAA